MKCGGPEHDDEHSIAVWFMLLTERVGKMVRWPFDVANYRRCLIELAALCVAAVEALDRQ